MAPPENTLWLELAGSKCTCCLTHRLGVHRKKGQLTCDHDVITGGTGEQEVTIAPKFFSCSDDAIFE